MAINKFIMDSKIYMKIIILFVFLIGSTSIMACELTEEYEKVRMEVTNWALYEYKQCTQSAGAYYYWKKVAKCKKEGRGKNVGGGCQHIAGYTEEPKEAFGHCEILRIDYNEQKKILKQYIKEKNIVKCRPFE